MMLVDCGTCPVREIRCADCVVTALSGMHDEGRTASGGAPATGTDVGDGLPLDPAERRAVSIFVAAGLVGPGVAESLTAAREPARTIPVRPAARRAVG